MDGRTFILSLFRGLDSACYKPSSKRKRPQGLKMRNFELCTRTTVYIRQIENIWSMFWHLRTSSIKTCRDRPRENMFKNRNRSRLILTTWTQILEKSPRISKSRNHHWSRLLIKQCLCREQPEPNDAYANNVRFPVWYRRYPNQTFLDFPVTKKLKVTSLYIHFPVGLFGSVSISRYPFFLIKFAGILDTMDMHYLRTRPTKNLIGLRKVSRNFLKSQRLETIIGAG